MRGVRAVRVLLVFLVAGEARLAFAFAGGAADSGFAFFDLPADSSSAPSPEPVMAAVATLLNWSCRSPHQAVALEIIAFDDS